MFFTFRRRVRRVRRRKVSLSSQKKYLEYRESARALAHERILSLNTHYKVAVNRIFIRNSRSRWGSCSTKGNLNFNYRLVFLPPALVDYVIVHELCHLREFNHSPRFWAHVSEIVPNHKALRRELRRTKIILS